MSNGMVLRIENGPQAGQVFSLIDKQTIGRGVQNNLVINDETVSKTHAKIAIQQGRVYVQDLDSTNGTYINGKRLAGVSELKPGDSLQIGSNTRLNLQADDAKTIMAAAMSVSQAPPASQNNNGLLIGILVLLVILIGGGGAWFVLSNQPSSTPPPPTVAAAVAPTDAVAPATDTLASTDTPAAPTATPTSTPLPQTQISFRADRSTLSLGDCATVMWQVENAQEARLDGEAVSMSGTRLVCPSEPEHTYRLIVLTHNGDLAEEAIQMTVLPTATPLPNVDISFNSNRDDLAPGECAVLSWQVANAQSITLNGETVGLQGRQEVCPDSRSTTYRLLVTSQDGGIQEQTVILRVAATPTPTGTAPPTASPLPPTATPRAVSQPVTQNPVVNQFIADKYILQAGECTMLHWSVSNATQVRLSDNPVANQGSQQVCPPTNGPITYRLYADGKGGTQATALLQLTVGNSGNAGGGSSVGSGSTSNRYALAIGGQHLYEQPWGDPGSNPCRAWENNSFDDKNPNFRGFNVELLLTNYDIAKVQDDWGEDIRFFTNTNQEVVACYYGYQGAGPVPQGTTSLTFFTVVPANTYVSIIQLDLNGENIRLCLDGRGGSRYC